MHTHTHVVRFTFFTKLHTTTISNQDGPVQTLFLVTSRIAETQLPFDWRNRNQAVYAPPIRNSVASLSLGPSSVPIEESVENDLVEIMTAHSQNERAAINPDFFDRKTHDFKSRPFSLRNEKTTANQRWRLEARLRTTAIGNQLNGGMVIL